jgi:hypothetical protein
MIRFDLATLVVSATLPLAALAQTMAEANSTPAASIEVVPSAPVAAPPDPITIPVTPAGADPAPPPATAPVAAPIAAAPAPAEPAPAEPPTAASVAGPPTPPAPSPAAAPGAPPTTPSTQRRAATKPSKPRAATAVTVVNGREIPAVTITVMAGAKAVSHAGPLVPDAKATLNLPKIKGCLITVEVTFEGGSVSDGSVIDVCRVKLVRLTD